jgi:RNA polymerase sigma-70 factor, ECF subfamily
MTSDWACLALAREGNDAAWRILFQRHHAGLLRMTSLITGSIDAAQDLVQESFVRLLDCDIKHHDGSFKAFLTTMAYRLALKERRRRGADDRLHEDTFADDTPSPLEAVIRNETDRGIIRVVQSLPIHQREILALRFYGGHSYEEIATITELPIGTVKSRIFYAVKACQTELKKRGIFA